MSPRALPVVAALSMAVGSSAALAGPDWTEMAPGAGSTLPTAQPVQASPVFTISGSLDGLLLRGFDNPDFEDVYLIYIHDPMSFSARTDGMDPNGVSGANFNTNLWLFDAAGRGLLGNQVSPFDTGLGMTTGSFIAAPSSDGVTSIIPGQGFYYLAISGAGNVPLGGGNTMFEFLTPMEISGPDGAGGGLPLTNWTGDGEIGQYTIFLTGVVPAPGGVAVFALGALTGLRRRRSRPSRV